MCGKGPCEAAHQRLLSGGAGLKPDDRHLLPLCNNCHHDEHSLGVITTWNLRTRLEFKGKEDLREYLNELCEGYYLRYKKE